jgi:phage terminase large subunit-like protein
VEADDDLMRRYHEVPLHEFCRYHLNMWVEPDEERWLPPGLWESLQIDQQIADKSRVVLGFDGSYSGDSTALVAATVEPVPHLFVLGLWEHPGGNVQWTVDHDAVEATVQEAFRRFEVVEMSADPPYWSQQLNRWMEQYGEDRVLAFNTFVRKRMAAACSSFYQAASSEGLTHDGHPGLMRHVSNAVLKETAQGALLRKRTSRAQGRLTLQSRLSSLTTVRRIMRRCPRLMSEWSGCDRNGSSGGWYAFVGCRRVSCDACGWRANARCGRAGVRTGDGTEPEC